MSGETVRYILLVKKGENSKIGYLFSSYFILKYSCSLPLNAFERNVQCSNFPRNLFSLSPWTIFATVSNIAQWPVSNQNNNIKDSWHLLTSIFDDSTSQYDKFYALWKSLYRWNDLLQKKIIKKINDLWGGFLGIQSVLKIKDLLFFSIVHICYFSNLHFEPFLLFLQFFHNFFKLASEPI